MGAVCTKACISANERTEIFGARRYNAIASVNRRAKDFEVVIDCFCVPSNRLLSRPTVLKGPGAVCRSVVVTTIQIEKMGNAVKELNSVIYTPVLQWFGIDIKQQVPKFLPMNLWPGSYTVFGFYNPEDSETSGVTLTGKIGNEQVNLEEKMDEERGLTNEQWSKLSKSLETEIEKMQTGTPKSKRSQDITVERMVKPSESDVVDEESGEQRDSLDTGYISHKRSFEQSLLSMQYIENTSDSEGGSSVLDKSAEKTMKMRRKDTPAHNLQHIRFNPINQDFKAWPLQEESESTLSSDGAKPIQSPFKNIYGRPVSSLGIVPAEENKEESDLRVNFSKSSQDLRDNDRHTRERNLSLSNSETETMQAVQRKKRSIISKIGALSIKAELEDSTLQKEKCCDLSPDADDEEDISHTDSEKTTGYLSEDTRNKEQDSENGRINAMKGQETECTSVVFKEDQTTDESTLEPTKGNDPENTEDEKSSFNEIKIHVRKLSYSKDTVKQFSIAKGTADRIGDNLYKDKGHGEKQTESKEKVTDTKHTSFEDEKTKEASARKRKTGQRKCTEGVKETTSRPRSRTFSSRNVFSFDEKEGRSRYIRPSKSVSLPKKSSGSKGQRKGSFWKEENERSISDFPASPSTPREAFSDVEMQSHS